MMQLVESQLKEPICPEATLSMPPSSALTRFDVMAADASGKPIRRVKLTCYTILPFFEQAPRALIGMETCLGAQWLARKLAAMGHTVRIIPAQFVKPFVKSNKNDARDAEAIAEAVVRPTMRFVEIRQEAQIDLQALHRIRGRISANRIQLICQMRPFCLEYGIAMRPGAGVFKLDMARILADETNDLTPMMRTMLRELWDEFVVVDARLATVSRQVEAIADRVDLPADVDPRDRATGSNGPACRNRRWTAVPQGA
jgi:transposase